MAIEKETFEEPADEAADSNEGIGSEEAVASRPGNRSMHDRELLEWDYEVAVDIGMDLIDDERDIPLPDFEGDGGQGSNPKDLMFDLRALAIPEEEDQSQPAVLPPTLKAELMNHQEQESIRDDLTPEQAVSGRVEGPEEGALSGGVASAAPSVSPEETKMDPSPPVEFSGEEMPPEDYKEGGMGAGFAITDEELEALKSVSASEESPFSYSEPPLPEALYPMDESMGAVEIPPEGEQYLTVQAFLEPGPTGDEEKTLIPAGDIPADAEMLEKEVTPDKITELLNRAEVSRGQVNEDIDSIPIAQQLLDMLRSGKTLLLSGKDQFEEAERMFNEVDYRLSYTRRVKIWSNTIANHILGYEIIWMVVLWMSAFALPPIMSGMVYANRIPFFILRFPEFIRPDDVYNFVATMMWGGLGGVVGALYSLWRHVSVKQDFNPQHRIWYYTQPIMGLPIGAFIFLVLRIGIGLTVPGETDISSPLLFFTLAWIAGFQQNVLYEIVRQILKLFHIRDEA